MTQEPAQLPLLPAAVLTLTDWFQTQRHTPPMIGWYETRVPLYEETHMRLWRGPDRGWGYPMSVHWSAEQNFAYQWLDNPNQAAADFLEWRGVVPGCIPEACYPYALHLTDGLLVSAQYPDFRQQVSGLATQPMPAADPMVPGLHAAVAKATGVPEHMLFGTGRPGANLAAAALPAAVVAETVQAIQTAKPLPRARVSVAASSAANAAEVADIPLAAWVDLPAAAKPRVRNRVLTV